MVRRFLLSTNNDSLAAMDLDSQQHDTFGTYIQVSALSFCLVLLSMLCFLLGVCVVQLAHHLDHFMRLSASVESQATGTIHGTKEANKIASEAEKRASKAEREVLRANKAWVEAIVEAEHHGRILKEAIASKHTRASIAQANATKVSD